MDDLARILDLALGHQRAGRLDDAASIYQNVLEVQPGNAAALNGLGSIALARHQPAEAAARLAEAVLAEPGIADFHANLAAAYLHLGERAAAVEHARRATALDPAMVGAEINLGNALFGLGDAVGAVDAFDRARSLAPWNDTAWTNYLFALNFLPGVTPETIHAENRRWGQLVEAAVGAARLPKPPAGEKLRLAYFLPEMDTHVTVRFLEPVLRHHDRAAFEVFGYGHRADGQPPNPAFEALFDGWTDTAGMAPAGVAARMRADGIRLFAHPCTFKARYREVLAHRAAPVQVACLNLVSTTGLDACDFLVTDHILDPEGETDRFHTETLIRLTGFNVYRQPPVPGGAPGPARAEGVVTFGSFNNVAKLTPDVAAAWAEILNTVPESRLLLKHRAYDDAAVRERVRELFARHGVGGQRVAFEGFTPDVADYLAAYNRVDIALDPFPFGGGTTSYEALWMGVPVVTLRGRTLMGRLTADLVGRAGRSDLVAAEPAGYVATAVGLAADPAALDARRGELHAAARDTIFDAGRFTRELETAYHAAMAAAARIS